MNTPLRHVASVVVVMFVALLGSTTWIQYVQADDLNNDGRNVRVIYREYDRIRGDISVTSGEAIATTVAADDAFGYQRTYANGPLYAPVTGYFSIVNGTLEIESTENDYLNGESTALWADRFRQSLTGEDPQGSSVQLTIDPIVQQAAYQALGDQRGAVVAIEPATGRILALVSTPSYDPNLLASHNRADAAAAYQAALTAEGNPMANRALRGDTYPPGSVFKLVTAAAALESGAYTAQTEVEAPRTWTLPQSSSVLPNFGGAACSPSGRATLAETMRVSCNTSFAILGSQLGAEALRAQATKFGYDTALNVPMKVTPSRFPPNPDAPKTALAAIGQGDVMVTPLEVAMTTAAIANDGVQMTPYTVERIVDPKLDVVAQGTSKVLGTPISPQTAEQLTQMMIGVVNDGSGKPARIANVQVAGKTGTAQTTSDAAPHAWFTAFAPADNPQVAVAVIVENGGAMGDEATGGAVAAPIAKAVIEAVIGQ